MWLDHIPDPPQGKHGRVVVDVQEGELVVLSAQHEHGRVEHLDDLGDVEPPQHPRYPQRLLALAVVHRLATASEL